MNKQFKVGNMVAIKYDGIETKGIITSVDEIKQTVSVVVLGVGRNIVVKVAIADLKQTVEERFPIGSVVKSILGNNNFTGFYGRVTGYEGTSHVICQSLKGKPDRVRFAYEADALELYDAEIYIDTKSTYRGVDLDGNNLMLFVVEDESGHKYLVNRTTRQIFAYIPSTYIKASDLADIHLRILERV